MRPYIIFMLLILTIFNLNSEVLRFQRNIGKIEHREYYTPENVYFEYFFSNGNPVTSKPGEPFSFSQPVIIDIPENFIVSSVNLLPQRNYVLGRDMNIAPFQGSYPMSLHSTHDFIQPDEMLYQSDSPYPESYIEDYKQGNYLGRTILVLLVNPLRYYPREGKMEFFDDFEVVVEGHYKNFENTRSSEDINDTTFIIVTSGSFTAQSDSFVKWHRRRGISSTYVTTNWVDNNYSGRDIQEKIRNYLIHAHQNYNTEYVLLVGDWNLLPGRFCRINMQSITEDIPTDLYYSDLDGSWDANGNSIFGEIEDSLDLFPDIIVGRALVSTQAEAWIFINKTINYADVIHSDYQKNIIFVGNFLDYDTDGGIAKDYIYDFLIPGDFNVFKLYTSLGNLSVSDFLSTVNNNGYSYINHIGHAGRTSMQCGAYEYLDITTVMSLMNTDKGCLVYSTGCLSAAYDDICIGWSFISNQSGGGIAYIGNSRYGWYTPGFPGCGTSEVIDYNFFKSVFSDSLLVLGDAFVYHKLPYIPLAMQETDYRWLMFALNLFGDPTLFLSGKPDVAELNVTLPYYSLPTGSGSFPVVVTDTSGNPIINASVALSSEGQLYGYSQTDGSGRCLIVYDNLSNSTGEIRVSTPNYKPVSVFVNFTNITYRLQLDSVIVLDTFSSSNSDGLLAPGERAVLDIHLTNTGNNTLNDVIGNLVSGSPYLIIHSGTDTINSISPSGSSSMSFEIHATDNAIDHSNLDISCLISSVFNCSLAIPLEVNAPSMRCSDYSLYDSISGNSNGYFEAGEEAQFIFSFINYGSSPLYNPEIIARSDNSYITIQDSVINGSTIVPGDTLSVSFILNADNTAPEFLKFSIEFQFQSNNLPGGSNDTVPLMLGQFGFHDDMEGDTASWVHSGSIDMWHISTRKSHSGNSSWYCGNETSGQYPADFVDSLTTIFFKTGPDMYLSFWQWFEVEGGFDYCLLQILDQGQWNNFATYTGSSDGWENQIINLDVQGDSTKLRFIFYSEDNQYQYEGWYVDDVYVYSKQVGVEEVAQSPEDFSVSFSSSLINSNWEIYFELPDNQRIDVKIFDISGREIINVFSGEMSAGRHKMTIREILPSGIYFLNINCESSSFNYKLFSVK